MFANKTSLTNINSLILVISCSILLAACVGPQTSAGGSSNRQPTQTVAIIPVQEGKQANESIDINACELITPTDLQTAFGIDSGPGQRVDEESGHGWSGHGCKYGNAPGAQVAIFSLADDDVSEFANTYELYEEIEGLGEIAFSLPNGSIAVIYRDYLILIGFGFDDPRLLQIEIELARIVISRLP